MVEKNKATYTAAGDVENADHTLTPGSWRNDPCITGLHSTFTHNPPRNAKDQRKLLHTLTTMDQSHGRTLRLIYKSIYYFVNMLSNVLLTSYSIQNC